MFGSAGREYFAAIICFYFSVSNSKIDWNLLVLGNSTSAWESGTKRENRAQLVACSSVLLNMLLPFWCSTLHDNVLFGYAMLLLVKTLQLNFPLSGV
jgi:hypothetical protein